MDKSDKNTPPIVTTKDFDISKFKLGKEIPQLKAKGNEKDKSTQWLQFPKYAHNSGETSGKNNSKAENYEKSLAMVTDTVTLGRGGVLRVDDNYRKSDDDCTAMWIPLDEENGGEGAVALKKACDKIDKKVNDINKKDPDGYFVVNSGAKGEKRLKIDYTPIVRESVPPPDADDDYEPWLRTKVKIPFKEIKNGDEIKREIDVKIVFKDDDGKQQKIVARTIQELREYLTLGTKFKMLLEFKTFWISKTKEKHGHKCGFKITCKTLQIIERGKKEKQEDYGWDVFGAEDEKKKPKVIKADDTDSDDSDDDDDDAKGKGKAKPKKEAESSSDDSDDSDDDVKPVKKAEKKPVKKPAKKAVKKESSSDDDSDDD